MQCENQPLDAKTAAKNASEYLRSMIPQAKEILLEEIEISEDPLVECWHVTLSFVYDTTMMDSKAGHDFLYGSGGREYKTFQIDARTGQVKSMKIRKI